MNSYSSMMIVTHALSLKNMNPYTPTFSSLYRQHDEPSAGYNGELYSNSELTATQNLSTSPGAVDTVASADRNQQSPEAPWIISFEFAAPFAKNLASSKICVTRCTSAGKVVSDDCVNKPNRHRFLSFSMSNSMSLRSFISYRPSMSGEGSEL